MADSALWMIVPGNAALSAVILFLIAMPFLYAARKPVHELMRALGHLVGGPLRLVSRWLLAAAHDMMLTAYRDAYESRHKILNGFMPFWRSLDKTLARADQKMTSLNDRASQIDAQIDKYEEIVKKTDKAEHALTISQLTQFFVST